MNWKELADYLEKAAANGATIHFEQRRGLDDVTRLEDREHHYVPSRHERIYIYITHPYAPPEP